MLIEVHFSEPLWFYAGTAASVWLVCNEFPTFSHTIQWAMRMPEIEQWNLTFFKAITRNL